MRARLIAVSVLVTVVLLVQAGMVSAQLETPLPPLNGVMMCESAGGTVVERYPALGTNNPNAGLLVFALGKLFCEFTAEDGISISVPLDVLAANGPTIAAIAYAYPPEFQPDGTSGNPSYIYCGQLQSAIQFGAVTQLGSGWVSTEDETDTRTYCVFADGSMFDSFGLFYKSNGTIRGADLTGLFGWTPGPEFEDFFTSP
ncbi:MAG TPA: hypothetical protein VER79_08165 [Candidatus Limnocylindrales bacterium]|nr:hypothetical protein [Candidatus Limnocylindrales bacterium]